ncbi:HSP20 family protein [Gammaproteobacteria bacterium]
MYESIVKFPTQLDEFEQFRREFEPLFGLPSMRSSIRAVRSAFPLINVGTTSHHVNVYLFAPGVEPTSLEITVDSNLLTVSGERKTHLPEKRTGSYATERFSGAFRRVLHLPDDVDPERVEAQGRDGIVHITLHRHAETKPRRIEIK